MNHTLTIEGELTVFRAHELKTELLAAMAAATRPELRLDLGEVTDIDGTGLQLLLSARREAESRGTRLLLTNPSPRVAAVLQLTNLAGEIDPCHGPDKEPTP